MDSDPADGAAPARHRPTARTFVTLMILPAMTAGGIAAWSGAPRAGSPRKADVATEVVKRGPLDIKVTERGNLESANNLTLRCMVEGETSLLKIAEEGTRVEKDQVIAELDSARWRNDALVQKIKVESAAAALKTAETNVEIQKMTNASDVSAAELKLTLARLDLEKYKKGEFPQTRNVIVGEIDLAREYLMRAIERQAFAARLMRRGFTTTKMMDAERVALRKAQIDVDTAVEKQTVLDQFTYKRDLAEKEANARFYEREVVRVRLRAEAALVQRDRNLLAAKRTLFVETQRYEKMLQQIAACTIRSPRPGLVVYANSHSRRHSTTPTIFEGAVVTERQAIVDLPDVTDMRVNARIHESKIAMIREGQPATIHLDARAGETFRGVVSDVALVPMSGAWPNRDLKEYEAFIKLDDESAEVGALRPGMTAQVEILSDHLDAVLQAPVQSCVERGGRYFVWVREGDEPHRHEIHVGKSNETACEVLDGLAEGDEVVLHPRSVLPDEVALLEHEIPAAAPSSWDAQPSAPARLPDVISTPEKPVDAEKPAASPGETAVAPVAALIPPAGPQPAATTDARGEASSDPMAVFNWLDQDHDAKVTAAELPEQRKPLLSRMDTNGDKAIDRDEWCKGVKSWSRLAEGRTESGGGQ